MTVHRLAAALKGMGGKLLPVFNHGLMLEQLANERGKTG